MGLDQYLTAKKYIFSDETKEKIQCEINKSFPELKGLTVETLGFEVAYWRKANQIHNWFVENVQGGKDDCGEYHVSEEKLKELLDVVNKVLDKSQLVEGEVTTGYTLNSSLNKVPITESGEIINDTSTAEDLLPTKSGFFFGGTDYGQWYYTDLISTKEKLESILKLANHSCLSFYYTSSW